MAWDLENLNPSQRKYWDAEQTEWVDFRLVPDEEMQKIRKGLGLKSKQKYIPNTLTKRMDAVIDVDGSDDTMMKFNDAIICYQIEDWNLLTKSGELISCTDENKLKMFYGSPVFARWANKCLSELQKDLEEIEEEERKN